MLNISGSRGTTFIRCYLSIATSLGTWDSMYELGRSSTYPITGITDKVYSRTDIELCHVISSCSIGVFFAGCMLWAFHQWPTLWMQRACYSSLQRFCVIRLYFVLC